MARSICYVCVLALMALASHVSAQEGCAPGQGMYAGDWARAGVRVSLVKTGNDNSCSRYVTLEMVDEDRFARNPYAESLAVIVNFPPGPALVVPYESGKLVYNIKLQLPQLPCDASPSCVDYIGSICQQQGVGFYYQMRMVDGCQGGNEFLGIRDGETFNAATWNWQPNPAAACMPGNSAGYGNIDEGIQDIVARLEPHPTQAGTCRWTTALQLAPGPKFRDSDYIDMVSMRGTGDSNYGAGTRMFFKGQQVYNNVLPGPASCDETVLDVEVVMLNEFLGAYPAYVTGVNTCPFFSYKRYQLNKDQHYSFVGSANTGGDTPPAQGSYPYPTDAACTTPQPPQQLPCPAMLSTDEVRRGFGAFHDPTCQVRGGSWAVYTFPGIAGGAPQSCCRTCRWNKDDAVAAWLQPTELDDCPPCVKAFYEAVNNGPVNVVPLAPYVSDVQCPYPKPPNGDMTLPSWIYNPGSGKCYYKSSFAKGISGNVDDATRRCKEMHGGRLLKISSAAEDDFIRLNLLWTGFFGETYTGLRKPGRLEANFTNAWFWADGTPLAATDYQRWSAAPRNADYTEDEAVCMEYLPQQPKTWNPFACGVNKHYICERPATNPNPVAPTPDNAAPVDCTTMPAMPQGVVAPVALINSGGPAMCNYFAADNNASPVATGGGIDNWVGRDPTCQSQRAACSIRYGGAFSYTIMTAPGRSYRLRFTFSEVWWAAAGQRLFDVLVDGVTVLAGVDPYALAGAKFTPVVREVMLTAAGANMVVSLQGRMDTAAIASLEVFDMGAAPVQPDVKPPSPSPSPKPVTPSPSPSPVVTTSPSPSPTEVTPEPSPSPAGGDGSTGTGGETGSTDGPTGGNDGSTGSNGVETGTTEGPTGSTDGSTGGATGGTTGSTTGGLEGSTTGLTGSTLVPTGPSPNPSLLQDAAAARTVPPPQAGANGAATALAKPAVAILVALLVLLL